ncbi:MAG: peptidoglycan-binding domain-containing protein, partial [Pirellulales bacterium]
MEERRLLSVTPYDLDSLKDLFANNTISNTTIVTHGFVADEDGDTLHDLGYAIADKNHDGALQESDALLLDFDLASNGVLQIEASKEIVGKASGEVVLLYDWAVASNNLSGGWTTAAGNDIFTSLVDLNLVNPTRGGFTDNNLHFITHSFGAAVTSEAVEILAAYDIPVDQVTYLDPHDFSQGIYVDTAQNQYGLGQPLNYGASVWKNVSYADTYYQTRGLNGSLLPDLDLVPVGRAIPGAHNVFLDGGAELPEESTDPYGNLGVSGDHSYVWDSFYLGTVIGGQPAGKPVPENPASVDYATMGYALSSVAGGNSLREGSPPNFYTISDIPGGDNPHLFTDPLLNPATGLPIGFSADEIVNARWAPNVDPLEIYNGDFDTGDSPFFSDEIPGWSYHGGGGEGDIESVNGNHFLELNFNDSSRTHNRLYVDALASELSFNIWVNVTSTDDVLKVRLDGMDLGNPIPLNVADSGFRVEPITIPIPNNLRRQVHTLTFEIQNNGVAVDSEVRIDNVQFVESTAIAQGKTGDIIPVDLGSLHPEGGEFRLEAFNVIAASGERVALTKLVNSVRKDWTLTNQGQNAGYILFSERVEGLSEAFDETGRFYLAPGTVNSIEGDQNALEHGFQGTLEVTYFVDGERYSQLVDVFSGASRQGQEAVTVSSSVLTAMRVQQRLNFLGFPDRSGAPLVVDGIIGSKTASALKLFQAATKMDALATPAGQDGKLVSDTNTNTVAWLNSLDAPQWKSLDDTNPADPPPEHRYGTNWMIDALEAVVDFGLIARADIIGVSSPNWSVTPDRAGMDADIKVTGLNQAQRNALVSALESNLPTIGLTTQTSVSNNGTDDVLHLDFVAPAVGEIGAAQAEALEGGLREFGSRLASLESTDLFSKPLPLVGITEFSQEVFDALDPAELASLESNVDVNTSDRITLGQAIDFDEALDVAVFQSIADFFATEPNPTTAALIAHIETVLGLAQGMVSLNTVDETKLRIDVAGYQAARTISRPLFLGKNAQAEGLNNISTVSIDLDVQLEADFSFGLDLTADPTSPEAFFFDMASLKARGDVHVAASELAAFGLNVGILGVDVKVGDAAFNIDLDADLAVSLIDPDSDGLVTLAELLATPIETLATVSLLAPDGANPVTNRIDLELPINAILDGSNIATAAETILATATDVFGVEPTFDLASLGDLREFANITPQGLSTLLDQIGSWLGQFRESNLFNTQLPILASGTLGDALDLPAAWQAKVTDLLQSEDGSLTFTSIQELLAEVGLVLKNPKFTGADLTFDVELEHSLIQETTPIGFSTNLGGLGQISSDSTVDVQADVDVQFTVGLDLSPVGGALTLDDSTLLTDLNGGRGVVDSVAGMDDLRITLSDGTTFDVNLDGLLTVGAVRNALTLAGPGASQFEVIINDDLDGRIAKDHLVLIDKTLGSAGPFTVASLNGSFAGMPGSGLGIFGSAEAPNANQQFVIEGAPLHGDTLTEHLFFALDSVMFPGALTPTVAGTVSVTASDIDATARFGPVGVEIIGGTGGVSASIAAELMDPDLSTPDRITMEELLNGLGDLPSLGQLSQLQGSASLQLPTQADLFGTPISDNITAAWPSIFEPGATGNYAPSSLLVSLGSGLEGLLNFENLALGGLSTSTPLAVLNGGAGVRTNGGLGGAPQDLRITLRDGTTYELDIDIAKKVGQVIDLIQDGTKGRVTVEIDAEHQALRLIDATTGGSTFSVESINGSAAAVDLGIEGDDDHNDLVIDGVIAGTTILQSSIGRSLEQLGSLIDILGGKSFLEQELPILGKSLGELLDLAGVYTKFVEAFQANPGTSLTTVERVLEDALEQALGITDASGLVSLTYDESIASNPALRIDVDVNSGFDDNLALQLDLGSIGSLAGVNLIDVGGQAQVKVNAGLSLNFALGIDLSDPLNPVPFLYDTTSASLTAGIDATDIAFSAAVGPLGIFIGNGNGNNGTATLENGGSDATVGVSVVNATNGRLNLSDLSLDDLDATAAGALNVTLPVYLPTQAAGNFVGDITVTADLANLAGTTNINVPTAALEAKINSLNFFDDLDVMLDGWNGFFTFLEDVLDGQVLGVEVPLIGDQLKDAARFIGDLRQRVVDNLSVVGANSVITVQQGIFDALGPGGLDWLQSVDANPDVTIEDVLVFADGTNITTMLSNPIPPIDENTEVIEFEVSLQKSMALVEEEVDFDIGLPGLGLEIDGNVQLMTGFDFPQLRFGVSSSEGAFVRTDLSTEDLTFGIQASLPGLQATGTLGFLQIDATDMGSLVDLSFAVDFKEPSGDGRLTIDELFSVSELSAVVDAQIDGVASVDLHLVASFGGNVSFPTIDTDFTLDWDFVNVDTSSSSATLGDAPMIAFNNVTLNPGQVIREFAGPILDDINSVIEPARPIIDILTDPLPVI